MLPHELLVFRGEAVQANPGAPLIVRAAFRGSSTEREVLELAGGHSDVAVAALAMASPPIIACELSSALAQRCGIDPELAHDVVAHLVEHRVLLKVFPAADRIEVDGDGADARALQAAVERAVWPVDLPRVTISCLGALGSSGWRERLGSAFGRSGRVLSWSLEGDGAWVGPAIGRTGAPCPACLATWRTAVNPMAITSHDVLACSPQGLNMMCQHVLLRAELWVANGCNDDGVLYIAGDTVSGHTLLRQPGCHHCVRPTAIAHALPGYPRTLETQFCNDWDLSDAYEPSEVQRAPFIDAKLGPLALETYMAPGLFRGLPLALGSIRLLQPRGATFERRELCSVMFGGGMTESRRQLVAFAEGIERYALSIDAADLKNLRLSDLGPEAVPPGETVRYATHQCSGDPGAPVRYEDQPLDWSWACDWASGQARLLAHDVFALDRDRSSAALRWMEDPFSSGAAAHRSLPLAARRAVLELVERDGLMLTWYLRLPLREFDIGCAPNREVHEVREYLAAAGIDLRCFDMRVDFNIPSILVVAQARKDCGQWRAGGQILAPSTAPTWDEAVSHALHEILGHYTAFAVVSPDGDSSTDPITGESRVWWPNFAAYFNPRQDEPLSFLGSDAVESLPRDGMMPANLSDSLAVIKEQFRARNIPVFVRYLAPEAIRRSGLVAVRACAPGLIRMTHSRSTVNFGERRFEEVRSRWGVSADLNPLPHPVS